jgi:hypothetical protein
MKVGRWVFPEWPLQGRSHQQRSNWVPSFVLLNYDHRIAVRPWRQIASSQFVAKLSSFTKAYKKPSRLHWPEFFLQLCASRRVLQLNALAFAAGQASFPFLCVHPQGRAPKNSTKSILDLALSPLATFDRNPQQTMRCFSLKSLLVTVAVAVIPALSRLGAGRLS